MNWRNVTVQLSGGNHNVLIADNTINQRGDSLINGWASESNPNPGLIVAPWYGRGWVSGPFTRDMLYAGNVTTRDADVAESPPGYVGYTSDGGEGMYLGKVASVAGTTLHLAGPTRIPMTGDDPPQPVSYDWAGAIVQILDGRGAGQWRFLTVEKPGTTSVEVDRPWDIEPDGSSTVTLVNLTGRTLLIDNDFAQAPLTQDYFLTLDNIRAGNRFGVEGTSAGVVSWAGNAYSGTLPAWHYQMLGNQVVRGPRLEFVSQNLNFFDAGYGGVLGAGHVYRNNTNSSAGEIVVRVGSRENTFADMVIEHNQANTISFENLNPPAPYSLSGVLVRNNQVAGGNASTVLPAGVIDGVTVVP